MSSVIFAIAVVMFLMDTSIYVIDINNTVKEISYTLTSHSALSLADRYALLANLPWAVESALFAFMVCP